MATNTYVVMSSPSRQDFEKRITGMIKDGWHLIGGVSIGMDRDTTIETTTRFYQAMGHEENNKIPNYCNG